MSSKGEQEDTGARPWLTTLSPCPPRPTKPDTHTRSPPSPAPHPWNLTRSPMGTPSGGMMGSTALWSSLLAHSTCARRGMRGGVRQQAGLPGHQRQNPQIAQPPRAAHHAVAHDVSHLGGLQVEHLPGLREAAWHGVGLSVHEGCKGWGAMQLKSAACCGAGKMATAAAAREPARSPPPRAAPPSGPWEQT